MERIIECVPNFSEGKNRAVIDGIAAAITGARTPDGKAVTLLDVDPGEAAGRTVYTFTGSPEAVVEAAYQGVRYAARAIDMRLHHGTHPRQGACDVLPLIPLQGITLEECARTVQLSVGRFGHLFTEYYGISPHRFLLSLRLDEARDLLINSGMSINRVAEKTGFLDPCYFSRLFKKYTGLTPKEYRSQKGGETP